MKKKKLKKETWSKIRCALFFIALYASWIIPCFMKYQEDYGLTKTEEMIESTEDVLRFRMEDVDTELAEVTIVPVEKSDLKSLGTYFVTAYCACGECTDGDGLTALNKPPVEGRTVAVDPAVIPFGTVLVINGHEYVAEDSGVGWIEGKELDIFFESHEVASEYGEQYVEVFVAAVQDD